MTPAELIRDGRLAEAREILVARLKTAPDDTKARTLLLQALAFSGEWDKVERHLELLVSQLPESATGVLVYRNLVVAEKARQKVAAGRQVPEFMTDPPPFLGELLEARKLYCAGDTKGASELLERVAEQGQGGSGKIGKRAFSEFSECDATFCGVFEVFVHDRYLWVPILSVRELSVQKPKTLFEMLWAPGRIVAWNGLTTNCFFPVLYPDTWKHENVQVRMGKMTDWEDLGNRNYRGAGQHLFLVGEQEMGLLEIDEVTFDPPASEEPSC